VRHAPLLAYSPDFNADEAIWDWVWEEVTANVCLGTKNKVQEAVDSFFTKLDLRADEVTRRCRKMLQSSADELRNSQQMHHVDPITVSL
jgi:hypothetical protein